MDAKNDLKAETIETINRWLSDYTKEGGYIDKILNSGCIDVNQYDGSLRLPNAITAAILGEISQRLIDTAPNKKEFKREVKNIQAF